ncbi:hypothetical protein, partial [Acinetobacter baumannii]|uniref:hypothetical protein n=1 Tax=Acinetobacter baumannii TaxID=470 RepID=UPI001A7E630F
FNIVIKRPAKAQQTGVVCRLKGNFASVYIQTVPLVSVSPDAEHLPASKEIIHAIGKRRKHCNKDGDKERKNKAHRNGRPENYG